MAKREPRWVGPFLRVLERTGNVRMAAERAGVDYTSAYQRRKRHADFAEKWEGALARFKEATANDVPLSPLRCAESPFPPEGGEGLALPPSLSRGPPSPSPLSQGQGGAEVTIHPDGKLMRAGPGRWSMRREGQFLAALAETANVRRAAEEAGVSTVAIYARRLKHPDFAEAWEAALDTGKARLEAMLVEAAQRRFDPDTLPIKDGEPQVSVGEAIHIVKLKRSEPGRGPANGGGREPRRATPEEAEKALIRRLKVFAARVQKEDIANGWSVHEGQSIPPGWVRAEDACCARCGAGLGTADEINQANSSVGQ